MGRIRISTYRRMKQVLMTCVMCICALTLLLAAGFTSHPISKRSDNVITDFSDYVSKQIQIQFRRKNISEYRTTSLATPNTTVSTTTPVPVKDVFRDWFDLRPNVVAYETSEKHPYLPELLISNVICDTRNVDILIYFNSACDNFQRRRILRETWASRNVFKDITIRVVFVLGTTSKNDTNLHIKNENMVYRDIIQGNFVDSFRNLTYKAMTALHWINNNCSHARYVIKADDDMFVNIFKVVENVLPQMYQKNETVFCHYKKEGTSKIIREPKDKWYVPPDVLSDRKTFPDFCSGYTVVMTTDIVPFLYKSSFYAPFLSIDDVYMFGVLPMFSKKLTYIDAKAFYTLNGKVALEQYKGSAAITYIVANAWQDGAQEDFWTATLSKLSKWAKPHANIIAMRNKMGPATL